MSRPAFRQEIKPGQSGRDVIATKRVYEKAGVPGAGALAKTDRAGPAWVKVTKTFQRHHNLKADGYYGRSTHEKLTLAVHWTRGMIWLYNHAKIRDHPEPPPVDLPASAAAKKLVAFYEERRYVDLHYGADIAQIRRTANGQAVWSQCGIWVHLDRRPLDLLVWLIEGGHKIGTFALCSDHHCEAGEHGHGQGYCVDIDWIDGVNIAGSNARTKTLELAKLIHNAPGDLKPAQLITGGWGNRLDAACEALTIPNPGVYGYATMTQHCNHIHAGYF